MAARQDQEPQDRDAELYAMACSGTLTDVDFRVDGQVFSAHRAVLCASSSYFRTMFTSGYKEAQSREPIPMAEVSAGTFQMILAFLYTKAVALPDQADVGDLLRAAKRYGMDGLVTQCIEAVQDGHINASNCLPLLNTACALGEHGRDPVWSALFKACAEYAAENLVEILDKWDGNPPQLRIAGMCRLVELASPKVVSEPLLLRRLWKFVKAWGRDALGSHDLQSFFAALMQWTFEAADFLDGVDSALELTMLDAGRIYLPDVGDPFRAGRSVFWPRMQRRLVNGKDWYVVSLRRQRDRGEWSPWCCHALLQFRWLHSSGSPENDMTKSTSNVARGVALLEVAEAHAPGAGYIEGGRGTVRVTVKVNPLVGLCTAAAFLDDSASPASVLQAITDVEMLRDMLQADSLPIESEGALLDALADFADSDASEELAEKVAALVPALRLDDVDFRKLVSAVRASPGLEGCKKFRKMLRAYLRRARAKHAGQSVQAQTARAPLRGAVWRSLQGPATAGKILVQPKPPRTSTLVRYVFSAKAGLKKRSTSPEEGALPRRREAAEAAEDRLRRRELELQGAEARLRQRETDVAAAEERARCGEAERQAAVERIQQRELELARAEEALRRREADTDAWCQRREAEVGLLEAREQAKEAEVAASEERACGRELQAPALEEQEQARQVEAGKQRLKRRFDEVEARGEDVRKHGLDAIPEGASREADTGARCQRREAEVGLLEAREQAKEEEVAASEERVRGRELQAQALEEQEQARQVEVGEERLKRRFDEVEARGEDARKHDLDAIPEGASREADTGARCQRREVEVSLLEAREQAKEAEVAASEERACGRELQAPALEEQEQARQVEAGKQRLKRRFDEVEARGEDVRNHNLDAIPEGASPEADTGARCQRREAEVGLLEAREQAKEEEVAATEERVRGRELQAQALEEQEQVEVGEERLKRRFDEVEARGEDARKHDLDAIPEGASWEAMPPGGQPATSRASRSRSPRLDRGRQCGGPGAA